MPLSKRYKAVPSVDCIACQHRTLGMFCNFSPVALADFNSVGKLVSLPSGAILMREGDPGERIFVICSGQVKLSCMSKEGKVLNLRIALPGDVLGLSAVVSGTAFEVTTEAMAPTTVNVVLRDDFLAFLLRHGEASLHAARTLSAEYRSAFVDARRLALSGSAAARLASILLDWGRAAACEKHEMRFTMTLTHDDLASFAGSSRETISRTLGSFQRDNLIQIHGATVRILLPEKLAELVA